MVMPSPWWLAGGVVDPEFQHDFAVQHAGRCGVDVPGQERAGAFDDARLPDPAGG